MCDRWIESFENFLEDMGNKPKNMSIDNNGNYSTENWIWVNRKIQERNKRSNHIMITNGITKCLIEWSEIYNIKILTIYSRISRGIDIMTAITQTKMKLGIKHA